MNWQETREKLLKTNPKFDLPKEWQWRINLRSANLSDADLRGANLSGADLSGANLSDADLNWQSHDLLAEILFRTSGQDIEKRKIAGLILISKDWCWKDFLKIEDNLKEWALSELAKYANDNAPDIIEQYRKEN